MTTREGWFSKRLLVFRYRRRILRKLESGLREAWPLIEEVFGNSRVLYQGRVGADGHLPFQAELLDRLLENRAEAERILSESILSANPMVSAYCVFGLQKMGSRVVENLPQELFDRDEIIEWRGGCFGHRVRLGSYAEGVQSVSRKP